MLEACLAQTEPADEIIVALMGGTPDHLPDRLKRSCRFVTVTGEKLPLAEARNAAAAAATTDQLIFLDVDCIPSPDLVRSVRDVAAPRLCLTGDCRYLARGQAETSGRFEDLWSKAEHHPARPLPEAHGEPFRMPRMTDLWSLNFALPTDLFRSIGGFDERFVGYGGEDTDFAVRLGQTGAELVFVPGMRAVHQWHPVSIPPLQHFDDIVENARRFREIHGAWCMDYWLDQLQDRGFIHWAEERISVLRKPSGDDLEAARQPPTVRFS
jgi:GT2 family glycosyltransferase